MCLTIWNEWINETIRINKTIQQIYSIYDYNRVKPRKMIAIISIKGHRVLLYQLLHSNHKTKITIYFDLKIFNTNWFKQKQIHFMLC